MSEYTEPVKKDESDVEGHIKPDDDGRHNNRAPEPDQRHNNRNDADDDGPDVEGHRMHRP